MPLRLVLFAAHCLTLRLLSGSADITTGLVTHGRPEVADSDRLAGLFLNTMPFRLGGGQASWLEVVRDVVRQERDSHPYRAYPLSAVQSDRGGAPCWTPRSPSSGCTTWRRCWAPTGWNCWT